MSHWITYEYVASSDERDRTDREADADGRERKERVLHTRVPESLERHLKRRARGLGLSVSTVVRHVLLNTFGLVEDIVTDSTNIALTLAGEEPASAPERRADRRDDAPAAPAAIVGWQEIVLNLNAVCDRCNAILAKGSRAAIAVHEGRGPRVFICTACLAALGGGGAA